jgi:ketosteroid isomerase-like protein
MVMTVKSPVRFDAAAFRRSYEAWDVDRLLDMYDEGLELVQVSRDNPPSAPLAREGRASLEGMLRHCASAGVVATVERVVADEQHAAATVTCAFPGGRQVVANSIMELRDGRIVRQHDVVAGDPRS